MNAPSQPPLSPEDQAVEDKYMADLPDDRARAQYRIHVEAGGCRACDYMRDPDTPLYPNITRNPVEIVDYQDPSQFDTSTTEGRAASLAADAGSIKRNIENIMAEETSYDNKVQRARREAAERLGLTGYGY